MSLRTGITGVNFSDPRAFFRSASLASKLTSPEAGVVSSDASNISQFFINIAAQGLADDSNWTANTYKTLLSISSGKGLVSAIVGPTGLAGTPTTTFEITVDGVLTEVAVAQTTTGHRSMLGALIPSVAMFTTAGNAIVNPDSFDAAKAVNTFLTLTSILPSWQFITLFGTPCLAFQSSLLIRAKSSENNSTTTNVERRSAIMYVTQP